jgi:hypothetical protein
MLTLCFFAEPNAFSPVLTNNGEVVHSYHGVISENQETVTLSPPLRASDSDKIGGASKSLLII